ncbi:MAG: hypothetical protein H6743_02020 [Rickettsiaceae bacterium]|nr:hypothetical protein [Rickettsiaceae bacterium]MCP5374861.1 hypothetical protein [Rickettsiaceae bacterium]
MSLVKRRISDKWIIRMIKGWLDQAVFKQDETVLANKYSSRFSHKPLACEYIPT